MVIKGTGLLLTLAMADRGNAMAEGPPRASVCFGESGEEITPPCAAPHGAGVVAARSGTRRQVHSRSKRKMERPVHSHFG